MRFLLQKQNYIVYRCSEHSQIIRIYVDKMKQPFHLFCTIQPSCTFCVISEYVTHYTNASVFTRVQTFILKYIHHILILYVPQLFSVYHSELPPQGATAYIVWPQVPRLEHHSWILHWLLILHVDPHLHGLQAGVDSWISQTGQKKMYHIIWYIYICIYIPLQ